MELFAADGHDAGGCERVTGKSGMRPSDFSYHEAPLPTIGDGQFLVRTLYVSVDPGLRGWLARAPEYLSQAIDLYPGRPLRDARPDDGASGVQRAPADRIGDVRSGPRAGGRVAPSGICRRRLRIGAPGLAGLLREQRDQSGSGLQIQAGAPAPTVSRRVGQQRHDRLFRDARRRQAARGGDRARVRRSRGDRLDSGADRQDSAVPRHRDRRGAGETPLAHRRARTRCRHRLQVRGSRRASEGAVSRRRQRVLRQRRWTDARDRAGSHGHLGTHRPLRHDLRLRPRRGAGGSRQPRPSGHTPPSDGGVPGPRLRPALQGKPGANSPPGWPPAPSSPASTSTRASRTSRGPSSGCSAAPTSARRWSRSPTRCDATRGYLGNGRANRKLPTKEKR